MVKMQTPVQFQRQFPGPLDESSVAASLLDLEALKTSPILYDGMPVSYNGVSYIYHKATNKWVPQGLTVEEKTMLSILDKSGSGINFLNDKGEYVEPVKPNWNSENPDAQDYINNKPSLFSQEEIISAFDVFLDILSTNYSTKSELAALPVYFANNKEVLSKFSSVDGSLFFNNKLVLTNIDFKNCSYTVNADSPDFFTDIIDVSKLLANKTLSNFSESEVLFSGNLSVQIFDGSILLDSFSCTNVEKFDIGVSPDIIIKVKGTGIVKLNYVSIERS